MLTFFQRLLAPLQHTKFAFILYSLCVYVEVIIGLATLTILSSIVKAIEAQSLQDIYLFIYWFIGISLVWLLSYLTKNQTGFFKNSLFIFLLEQKLHLFEKVAEEKAPS